MITEEDLKKLGYKTKTKIQPKDHPSTDFHYGNDGERPYLVNLSQDGTINIIFPVNAKNVKPFSTADFDKFNEWHGNQ
jgi:hypothetical protein